MTTTVTFSVNNTQIHNHQINESIQSDQLQLTLASNAIKNNNADSGFNTVEAMKSLTDSNGDMQVSRLLVAQHGVRNADSMIYVLNSIYSLLLDIFVSNLCIYIVNCTKFTKNCSCSYIEYDAPSDTRRRMYKYNDS